MGRRTHLRTNLAVSVFLSVMLGISAYCETQEPFMVADIYPGANGSEPKYLTNVNGTLFFSADYGTYGRELWKSDGTEAGTVMVKDINPRFFTSRPSSLTNVDGTLFFAASDDAHGHELWKSDGTEAGTVMVKDINPDGDSVPEQLTYVNGTLFFSADDGWHGRALWKSDGTEAGTVMVKDINPEQLTNVNGTLFFSADDGLDGAELWKSDGTEAGTAMVKDIYPHNTSFPEHLTNVNGTLFFSASDGPNGKELWKSDGTEAGTVMVKDINPDEHSLPRQLVNVNGTLFFSADDGLHGNELWKSDGTEAGTVMVRDINPYSSSSPIELTSVDSMLFFGAHNGTHGYELWKSDGTEAGTVMVMDVNPGALGSDLSFLTDINGELFFVADNGTYGFELWKSEGTSMTTVMIADINPGASSSPGELTNVKGTFFFHADDGISGDELWAYTHSKRIFVDAEATGANNGSSWADAYLCLQDALTRALRYDEILVAQGTYRPDQGAGLTAGDRTATFQLVNELPMYGGHAGVSAPDPNARDIQLYKTILSGDLSGNDVGFTNNSENSYHVVTGSGTEPSTVLDGFIITAGNANGSGEDASGGGMINRPNGNLTISNCTFMGNWAVQGGGMRNFDHSSPTLTNCQLRGNSGLSGAGIYNGYYSSPTFTNCAFSGNTATNGGGMYNHLGSDATAFNCTFSGNSANSSGGGVYNYNNTPVLTNCTFSGNTAGRSGGGIYNYNNNPMLTNCILWGNSDDGGMDESAQIYNTDTSPVVNYCCIQGCTVSLGGIANIDEDPLFQDADGPDDISGTDDDNLRLSSNSPCIDTGDNLTLPAGVTTDLDGAPRITGWIVDMGAYEWNYLEAHWKLDERSGTIAYDSTVNGHDGTLNGNPIWKLADGRIAGALEFDGVVDHVAHDLVLPRQKGTIWHWLNPNDSTMMVPYYEGIGGQDGWGVEFDSLEIHTGVQLDKGVDVTAYFSYQDGTKRDAIKLCGGAVPVGEWTHVAVTWDTSHDAVLYVDGLEIDRADMSVRHFLSRHSKYHLIGAPSDFKGSSGYNRNWNGLIDDVRIYNYALSGDEVRRFLCDRRPRGDVNLDCRVNFLDFAIVASGWLDCAMMVQEPCAQ